MLIFRETLCQHLKYKDIHVNIFSNFFDILNLVFRKKHIHFGSKVHLCLFRSTQNQKKTNSQGHRVNNNLLTDNKIR
jgi:hypothetical protein